MSKQNQKIVLGVLASVMVFIYLRALKGPAPQAEAISTSAVEGVLTVDLGQESPSLKLIHLSSGDLEQREAQRQQAAQMQWGRDPFSRGSTGNQAGGLSLSGILWDAQAPIVIINGQMLRIGEEVEGYRITQITPEYVAVTDGAETFQLQNE